MARRPLPPPQPKAPILSAGQKRRRIERLQKCITDLEAFDHQKLRRLLNNPEVVALGAAIDKALSSAFGYGTRIYLRYNLAAKLDTAPLIANAALAETVARPVAKPARQEVQAQEARQYFTEGRQRSIALLREAIRTLEDEITSAPPIVQASKESKAVEKTNKPPQPTRLSAPSIVEAHKGGNTQKTGEVQTPLPRAPQEGAIKAAWRRVRQWFGRRN